MMDVERLHVVRDFACRAPCDYLKSDSLALRNMYMSGSKLTMHVLIGTLSRLLAILRNMLDPALKIARNISALLTTL